MKSPNVILIIIDAARQDHLSCYGYHRQTSPFIDTLSKDSLFFKNAYASAPWTVPSHASLFTGLFPSEHKTQNDNLYLGKNIPTLPEILASNDYTTVGFSDNMYVGRATGLDRGFQHFDEVWERYRFKSKLDLFLIGLKRILHMTDRGGNETTQLIIDWLNSRNKFKPFLMFVNYIDVHQICHPPRSFLVKFGGGRYSYRRMYKFMRAYLNGRVKFYTGEIKFTEEDWGNFKWIYDVAIYYIDYQISRIYEVLAKQGILDNTIFIITSDHGTNLGDHGLLHHEHCLYETLLRIPLIVRYTPLSGNKEVTKEIQLTDLFYMILDMSNIQYRTTKDERFSLQNILKDQDTATHVFAEWRKPQSLLAELSRLAPNYDFSKFDRGLRSLKVGQYKYIESNNGNNELYNLNADPREVQNIYEQNPERVKEMKESSREFIRKLIRQEEVEKYKELEADEELKKRLRSLGYIA